MYKFFTSFVEISNTRWWKVIWQLFGILGSSVKYHIPISLVSPFFRRSPSSCRPRYTSSPGRWGASSSSSSSSCLLWPPLSTGEIECRTNCKTFSYLTIVWIWIHLRNFSSRLKQQMINRHHRYIPDDGTRRQGKKNTMNSNAYFESFTLGDCLQFISYSGDDLMY